MKKLIVSVILCIVSLAFCGVSVKAIGNKSIYDHFDYSLEGYCTLADHDFGSNVRVSEPIDIFSYQGEIAETNYYCILDDGVIVGALFVGYNQKIDEYGSTYVQSDYLSKVNEFYQAGERVCFVSFNGSLFLVTQDNVVPLSDSLENEQEFLNVLDRSVYKFNTIKIDENYVPPINKSLVTEKEDNEKKTENSYQLFYQFTLCFKQFHQIITEKY